MGWRLISFFNMEICVHPFFLLLVCLWVFAGFPVEPLLLFLLVLAHEISHVITAKFLGIKFSRIELFPFGGVSYLSRPVELNPKTEFFVAAAGPLFNFTFLVFLSETFNNSVSLFWAGEDFSLVNFLIKANFFLMTFNLLPGLPLDGGRILRACLTRHLGFYKATETAASYGKALGIIFIIFGLLLSYYNFLNLSLSLMGIFLYHAAGREQKNSIYLFLQYLLRKEKRLRKYNVLKSEQLVALENTTLMEVLKWFKPSKYHQVVVISSNFRIKEILSETQILSTALQKGVDVQLKKLIKRH